MGVAAYQRGSAAIGRDVDAMLAEVRNDQDSKARLWAQLMGDGHVLTFHCPAGTFTAGPYQAAAPDREGPYALIWHGRAGGPSGRPPRDWRGRRPWDIAVRIIDYAGRMKPIRVTGKLEGDEG